MAYEREMIAPNTSAIPSQPQPEMRQERVFTPYQSSTARLDEARARAQEKLKSNQLDTSVAGSSVEPEVGEVPPTVNLSPAAAALARKEAKFRQQEQAFKAEKESIEKERLEIAEFKALKAKLDAKDYSALDGRVDYNEYTNYVIDKSAASSPEQERIKAIDERLTSTEKQLKDDTLKRFEAAVMQRRTAVKELIDTDAASYPSIKKSKQEEAVVQHILDTWENDGKDLTIAEAAKEVEMVLVETAKKWAALLETKTPESVSTAKELPPLKAQVKTLTNDMAPTGELKRPAKSFQGMTDAERWAEARRRAEEKLKLKG